MIAKKTKNLRTYLRTCDVKFSESFSSLVTQEVNSTWRVILNSCVDVMKGQARGKFSYQLTTDWSSSARGYQLMRVYEKGNFDLVDLGSEVFDGRMMSSFLGELSTIKWALFKVRHLTLGVDLVVLCDNMSSVKKLRNFKEKGEDVRVSRLYAWIKENVPRVSFEFLAGQNNELADALSRPVFTAMRKNNPLFSDVQLAEPTREEKLIMISEAHRGHWGVDKTLDHLRLDFGGSWCKMKEDVDRFVKSCVECQFFGGRQYRNELEAFRTYELNEIVHVDFMGPFKNRKIIIVGVDNFSKNMDAKAISNPNLGSVISFLNDWINKWGTFRCLQTDQAAVFLSLDFQEWLNINGVKHILTPRYYPQGNGIVERQVRTLLERLKRMKDRSWVRIFGGSNPRN